MASADAHDHGHHPHLAHHFEDLEQQRESHALGMWVFMAQEFLFFGGLFGAYTVYRFIYPEGWMVGSQQLDALIGGANTIVLLFSSFTMAMAVRYAQLGENGKVILNILLTMGFGLAFMVLKYFEYSAKFAHGLVPFEGLGYGFTNAAVAAVPGTRLFFGFYFIMTGMHALHMIIGKGLMTWIIIEIMRGNVSKERHSLVENFGLYWHFVDIVWIFLFPLLYLLGATQH